MDKFLPKLTALVRVLMSIAPPSEGLSVKELSFFDQSLNPSQQEAIRFALESPEVACIHGPPGELLSSSVMSSLRSCMLTPAPRYWKDPYSDRAHSSTYHCHSGKSQASQTTSLRCVQFVRRQHLGETVSTPRFNKWFETQGDASWSSCSCDGTRGCYRRHSPGTS